MNRILIRLSDVEEKFLEEERQDGVSKRQEKYNNNPKEVFKTTEDDEYGHVRSGKRSIMATKDTLN